MDAYSERNQANRFYLIMESIFIIETTKIWVYFSLNQFDGLKMAKKWLKIKILGFNPDQL